MLQTNIDGQKLRLVRVNGSSLTVETVKNALVSGIPDELGEKLAKVACDCFGAKEYLFIVTDDEVYELICEKGDVICKPSKMCTALVLELSSRTIMNSGSTYAFAKRIIEACDCEKIEQSVRLKKLVTVEK